MPITTGANSGTAYPLTAATSPAARITVQRLASNTSVIYLGFITDVTGGVNAGDAVTDASFFDHRLDTSTPSVTIGGGKTNGNPYDANKLFFAPDVNGEGVVWFIEQR